MKVKGFNNQRASCNAQVCSFRSSKQEPVVNAPGWVWQLAFRPCLLSPAVCVSRYNFSCSPAQVTPLSWPALPDHRPLSCPTAELHSSVQRIPGSTVNQLIYTNLIYFICQKYLLLFFSPILSNPGDINRDNDVWDFNWVQDLNKAVALERAVSPSAVAFIWVWVGPVTLGGSGWSVMPLKDGRTQQQMDF